MRGRRSTLNRGRMARRRRGGWLRWPLRIVAFLLILAVAATGVLYIYARSSIPDFDEAGLIAGLESSVTVVRDENAVPHIFAANELDAYRALGFVHAQDRFFQMEMTRRIGAGRIAEIAGQAAVPLDRFLRLFNFSGLAANIVAETAPEVRAALDAYAAGVNAWLTADGQRLPPELLLAGVIEPDPWRPVDSVIWAKLMALRLSGNFETELLRARLTVQLTDEQIADLWAQDETHEPTLRNLAALAPELGLDRLAAAIPDVFAAASASNEWVAAGQLTQSGEPLLANDPHLGFSAPGLWYLARLSTPDFEIAGATVPGVPFTLLGHNGHIAWGLTTAEADVQDLFVERLVPGSPDQYMTPNGPAHFELREEQIGVRFRSEPETLTIRSTRHGPVLSDVDPEFGTAVQEGHVLALSFTAMAPGDRTPEVMYNVNHARDWQSFRAALRGVQAPIQNFVYADVTGRIGFYTPGKVPMRRSGQGEQPAAGWTGAADWRGFIPFSALPQIVDPNSGLIVNANNRLVDDSYRYFIAKDWPEPFRARRIEQLLDESPQHSPASFAAIQNDFVSTAAQELVPELLAAMGDFELSERDAGVAAMLADWHGLMARERVEPTIFLTWMMLLGDRLWNDELGELAGEYHGLRPEVVRHMLGRRQAWCDNIETPADETCAEQIAGALTDAVDLLEERLGKKQADWRWARLHRATFRHQFLGRFPMLREFTGITIPTDGGPYTVNRGVARLALGEGMFNHIHGPGYRAIYDLSDLADSRFIIGTGQSGHPLSPHYDDLTERWRDGAYVRIAGTAEELAASAVGALTLTPAR